MDPSLVRRMLYDRDLKNALTKVHSDAQRSFSVRRKTYGALPNLLNDWIVVNYMESTHPARKVFQKRLNMRQKRLEQRHLTSL